MRCACTCDCPPGVEPDQVFLNGRRLLAPQIERGYLVVDRSWRNNEELYYDLPERKQTVRRV